MSLRARLTMWVVALFILLKLVTGSVFWLYERSTIYGALDRQLEGRAGMVATSVLQQSGEVTRESLEKLAQAESPTLDIEYLVIAVVHNDGTVTASVGEELPSMLLASAHAAASSGRVSRGTLDSGWPEQFGRDAVRGVAVPARSSSRFRGQDGSQSTSELAEASTVEVIGAEVEPVTGSGSTPLAVLVCASESHTRAQLHIVQQVLLVSGLFGLLATAVSGWYIAGVAVEPLNRVRAMAEKLGPDSLTDRIASRDDSSEVIQLTRALDAARERIRASIAAQERFLSHISHEIKTPIATLLVEAQTLDRDALSPPAAQFVRTTEEEMRRLGRLVEGTLTLTRIRDGRRVAKLTKILVNDLVLGSVAGCGRMATQHEVVLSPRLLDGDETGEATIQGDPELLRTMIDNLVRNAISFSPKKGRVSVGVSIEAGRLRLTVCDQGTSLSSETLARMFDRFVQPADDWTRRHGLGLAIAQAIAELHGGIITARTPAEGGVEFVVDVPLSRPRDDESRSDVLPSGWNSSGGNAAGQGSLPPAGSTPLGDSVGVKRA
ncbi:MAG: HAMP domain-containing sensor histidine kinase [Planctomycetota bacterium]|nr:HAMP domain-containing sensor histidine kinase [Planctomycetota bacterium]